MTLCNDVNTLNNLLMSTSLVLGDIKKCLLHKNFKWKLDYSGYQSKSPHDQVS